jgi:hypothetical protein
MRRGSGKIVFGILCSIIAYFGVADLLHAQAVPGLDAIRVASGLSSPLFVTAPPSLAPADSASVARDRRRTRGAKPER